MIKKLCYFFGFLYIMLVFANSSQADYSKAMESIKKYEFAEAVTELNEVTNYSAPDDLKIRSYFWLAHLDIIDKNKSGAEDKMRQKNKKGLGLDYLIELLPSDLVENTELLEIYEDEKEDFMKEQEKINSKIEKYLEKAQEYYNEDNMKKCSKYIEKVLELDPENSDALSLKDLIEENSGETVNVPVKAAAKEKKAVKEEAVNPEECYKSAIKNIENYEMNAALEDFGKVIEASAAEDLKVKSGKPAERHF